MPKYNVQVRQDVYEGNCCDNVVIENGVVMFFTDRVLEMAYAPGAWLTICLEEGND
jgi:hypothetical protein